MKTRAPEFRALIIIFGSAGPVISTRRSSQSAGAGGTVQSGRSEVGGCRVELELDPGLDRGLAVAAGLEEGLAARSERRLEVGQEREGVGREDRVDPGDGRPADLDHRAHPSRRMGDPAHSGPRW